MNRDANTPGFIQVGHVIRSHGLEGELNVFFDVSDPREIENLSMVYFRNDRGDFYPARITNLRVEGKRNNISFFVQFDHIADRTAAEAMRNQAVFLETEHAVAFADTTPDNAENPLLNCEVLNEDNEVIGLVVDVMDNPAHPILVVATTSGSRLIPYVDRYVQENRNSNIYCQNLDELEGI